MNKPLKIASIASEVDPYSKTGGLGDVARSLPKALKRLGHKTIIITPFHSSIVDPKKFKLKKIIKDVKVEMSKGVHLEADYWQGELMSGLPVYFVENNKYFGQRKHIYGSKHENARFFFFNLASLKLLKILNFQADIIHCHDWHTGLIPYFLKKRFKNDEFFANTATLYTIHNLIFQFGHNWWKVRQDMRDDGRSRLPNFDHSPAMERINFAKRAILNTEITNTVSEKYAEEITTKDFGEDLNVILKNRRKNLFGIVNGIDYNDFNPQTDPGLSQNYGPNSLGGRTKNKEYLQRFFKLPVKPDIPVLAMVTRIAEQKGVDLLMNIFEDLIALNIQFVIMGSGDKKYEKFFAEMQKNTPKKLAPI